MKNLKNIKGADELPKTLTPDWIEQAMEKLDKSQMTPDQRMNYEMMMARNASIIEMLKEREREYLTKKVEKRKDLETGKKLKDLGTEIETIMVATGLTRDEIEKL